MSVFLKLFPHKHSPKELPYVFFSLVITSSVKLNGIKFCQIGWSHKRLLYVPLFCPTPPNHFFPLLGEGICPLGKSRILKNLCKVRMVSKLGSWGLPFPRPLVLS